MVFIVTLGAIMTRQIDYGRLMHQAMRGLIQQVLTQIAKDGLPGDHHFFITFDTRHPDVQIADWLHARYPEEMTIVLQHWFDALTVTDDGFSVVLNFGDSPEPLIIPFDALRTFVDPSVEFGLRFESADTEDDDDEDDDDDLDGADDDDDDTPPAPRGEVVSLDKFRK